jgi:hypothetical protein
VIFETCQPPALAPGQGLCHPARMPTKHFGAIVALDGVNRSFACQEGQTIDFFHNKAVTTADVAAAAK